ncbi:MAG TPA: hypothetical protein VKZ79_13165 [Alphaproteobacteria bacterium]|nr:hypothetical protein [Alphaproteobacteria bacterium]
MSDSLEDAWRQFCATLEQIGAELLPAAPDDATCAEGVGYLARLAAYGVERFLSGSERLANGLSFDVPRIGGYNPDYIIGSANLASERRYRLTGKINDAYRIGVGAYSVRPDGQISTDGYQVLTTTDFPRGPDGSFELAIDAKADPAVGIRLKPTSNLFLIREIVLRPGDRPAEFALTCEQEPERALTAADVVRRMTGIRHFVTGSLKQFLLWSRTFAERPNEITPLPSELDRTVQGDPGTRYYSGYFDLGDDQALIVEIPRVECAYWQIQVTNHWLEPLPASHLNHVTAKPDADGIVRVTIAKRNPGRANWLDTGGRSKGAIFHRTIDADRAATPACYIKMLL